MNSLSSNPPHGELPPPLPGDIRVHLPAPLTTIEPVRSSAPTTAKQFRALSLADQQGSAYPTNVDETALPQLGKPLLRYRIADALAAVRDKTVGAAQELRTTASFYAHASRETTFVGQVASVLSRLKAKETPPPISRRREHRFGRLVLKTLALAAVITTADIATAIANPEGRNTTASEETATLVAPVSEPQVDTTVNNTAPTETPQAETPFSEAFLESIRLEKTAKTEKQLLFEKADAVAIPEFSPGAKIGTIKLNSVNRAIDGRELVLRWQSAETVNMAKDEVMDSNDVMIAYDQNYARLAAPGKDGNALSGGHQTKQVRNPDGSIKLPPYRDVQDMQPGDTITFTSAADPLTFMTFTLRAPFEIIDPENEEQNLRAGDGIVGKRTFTVITCATDIDRAEDRYVGQFELTGVSTYELNFDPVPMRHDSGRANTPR